MKKIGLYIHLPFCNKICSYCDFLKRVSSNIIKSKYIDALINELESKKAIFQKYQVVTIYLGGGTPSSLPLNLLEKLLLELSAIIDLTTLSEFTIECKAEDINDDFAKLLVKYQINRVSIGVESLNSKILAIIGRMSNYEELSQKVQILRENGLKNINFDYIYGIEPLSIDETLSDIKSLISLKPTHLSCYSLILEEKTILYHRYLKGEFDLMDEEKENQIYYSIENLLMKNNYQHYEISNFALTGYESIHNVIYWSNEEYLGIGLGSSSYLDGYRFKNIDRLQSYLTIFQKEQLFVESFQKSVIDYEVLNEQQKIEYEIILGLRMLKGIDLDCFENKYHQPITTFYPKIIDLLKEKYLEINDHFLAINQKYLYLQNQILLKIFS